MQNKIFKITFAMFLSSTALLMSSKSLAIGGMTGGGGMLIAPTAPTTPNDPEIVKHMVRNAKPVLVNFLENKKIDFDNGTLPNKAHSTYAKLFNHDKDIFEAMSEVRTDIDDDRPCRNSFNEPVDGSIHSKHRDGICISAYNISVKVTEEEIEDQSLALMLHEYTEVVGLDDDTAVELQVQALKDLKNK